jgi:D-alanyl-lipoteichoic acid acyltransferase DltB (MBOAT superfamily)
MLFNSIGFVVFFLAFFLLYWSVFNRSARSQNVLLLIGSYVFYACWDWRFLSLLIGVSVLTYYLGIRIEEAETARKKRLFLSIGLLQGIGLLLFFKYYNFFVKELAGLFHLSGSAILDLIVPLGISFFTFRTLAYLLDIEKGKLKASRDPLNYCAFVAFFPSIVSGPIDKAQLILPQLEQKREFKYDLASDGMRQILWGLFKKMVVADNCATISNDIFGHYQEQQGSTLLLGAVYFTIQLYADFSGYSDMAMGVGKLMGIHITRNFEYPLFAQNFADYWRKWHISLTAWVTEYVFTPLSIAFRDYGKWGLFLAILINLIVVGIWHGARWTYPVYGIIHALYFIPLLLKGTMNKKKKWEPGRLLPTFREALNIVLTFMVLCLTMIVFRAETLGQAIDYYKRLFSASLFTFPQNTSQTTYLFVLLMLIIEWVQRRKEHGLQIETVKYGVVRYSMYYGIVALLLFFGVFENREFIYVQF